MHLPDIINITAALQKPLSTSEILQTNQETQLYGLTLTSGDAMEIVAARNRAILDYNRVELGIEVIKKIIYAFCPSPYISQADYVSTLNELVDIFII